MNRNELSWQQQRFLKGSLSADELSAWALQKVVENDNAQPPIPQAEHDFLEEVLEKCALCVAPGQSFPLSEVRRLFALLESDDPHGKVWPEDAAGNRVRPT